MSKNRKKIIEYIKEFYPERYSELSSCNKRNEEETLSLIDKLIKDSKSYHGGMDMSGLVSFLSTIKMERFALGHLDPLTKFYPEQFEKIDTMIESGISRTYTFPPYTLSQLSAG